MTTYTVTAKRWTGGWELHIEDVGVTQVRSLTKAEEQVRDYLETLLDIEMGPDDEIVIDTCASAPEGVHDRDQR